MKLRHSVVAIGMFGFAALMGAFVSGCKDKKAPPPPPPPPPKAATTAPTESSEPPPRVVQEPVQIGPIMAQLKPDQRVVFPQDAAPTDAGIAQAVIKLASSLAKGDSDAMRPMLQDDAKTTLDGLVNSGDWEVATKRIESVRVLKVEQSMAEAEPTTFTVQMAIQEPGEAYVIGWQGDKEGAAWKLTGAKAPAGTKPRASDWAGRGGSESANAAIGGSSGDERPPMQRLMEAKTPQEIAAALANFDVKGLAGSVFQAEFDRRAAKVAGKPDHDADRARFDETLKQSGVSDEKLAMYKAAMADALKKNRPLPRMYYVGIRDTIAEYGITLDQGLKIASEILGITVDEAKADYEKGKEEQGDK